MFSFVTVVAVTLWVTMTMSATATDRVTPAHGIAMHGELKYPAEFQHFDYVNPVAPRGGRLRIAVEGSFDSLHPFIIKGQVAAGSHYVFESLMGRAWDEPFALYGLLADSISTPPDRSFVEFTLRPQARWHDGLQISVEDVLFSWRMLRDHGRPNHRSYYSRVAQAQTIGPSAVRFRFRPDSEGRFDREMPLIMGLMPILPRHYWAERDFQQTTLEPPLGSGPYQVVEVNPGHSITYHRLSNYWGDKLPVRVGLHNFDTIRYDYYRDSNIVFEAFKAGEADFRREPDPLRWLTAYDFPAVQQGRVVLESFGHQRPESIRALIFNTRLELFQNRLVRQAITLAFDAQWINRAFYDELLTRSTSYFPNSELAAPPLPTPQEMELLEPFRKTLPPELFTRAFRLPCKASRDDLRQALVLLSQAGWRTQQGLMMSDSGERFAFDIIILGHSDDEKIALAFARFLIRLGITARVRTVDSAQFQERLRSFDFDMIIHQWRSTLSPGREQLYYFGSQAADQPGSRNYPGIRSPAVDYLAAALSQTATRSDLVTRARALDRVLLWGYYAIPLFHQSVDHIAFWSHLSYPQVTPLYGTVLESWWVKP